MEQMQVSVSNHTEPWIQYEYWYIDIIYVVQCTVYIVHCIMYTLHYTMYTVHCTVYIIQYTLYTVQCTLYNVHCTLCMVHCIICYNIFIIHKSKHLMYYYWMKTYYEIIQCIIK